MPTLRVTAPDGTVYKITPPDGATQEQIDAGVQQIIAAHPAKAAPRGLIHRAGEGIILGGKDVAGMAMNLPAAALRIPGAIANAPHAIAEGAREAVAHPMQAVDKIAQATGALIPMSQTIERTAKALADRDPSQIPPIEDVTREATVAGLTQRLGEGVAAFTKWAPRALVKAIPGSQVERHSLAAPKIRAAGEHLRPTDAELQSARAEVAAVNPNLSYDVSEFRKVANDIMRSEGRLSNPDSGTIREMENFLDSSHQGWSFDQLTAEAQRLGSELGAVRTNIGARPGETTGGMNRARDANLRRLLAALHTDAEAGKPWTPAGPGAPAQENLEATDAWKRMRRLDQRNFAINGLARDLEKGIGIAGDGWTSVNVNRVLKSIQTARALARRGQKSESLWVKGFEPGELDAIESTLREIKRDLPRLPPGSGEITGSSQRAKLMGAGEVIGGGAATLMGADPAHALLAGTMTGSAMMMGVDKIAEVMASDAGRKVVRTALAIDPKAGPLFRNTLAAFLRTQSAAARGEPAPDLSAPPPRPAPGPSPQPTPSPEVIAAKQKAAKDIDELLRPSEQREAATK